MKIERFGGTGMKTYSPPKLTTLGFEIGLVTLFFVAGLAYQSGRTSTRISNWAMESAAAIQNIDALTQSMISAESAVRGYVITGEAAFLDKFNETATETKSQLARVAANYRATGLEAEQIQRLHELSRQRFEDFATILSTHQKYGAHAALRLVGDRNDIGRAQDFQDHLTFMRSQQSHLQTLRNESAQRAASRTFGVILTGGVLAITSLVLARNRMQRDMLSLKKQEKDLIEARNEAEKANRSKSQFLANVSHEIRTPMNAIVGMATLLSHGSLDDGQRESVRVIQKSSRSLIALIQDILDLSSIEAGKITFDAVAFRPIDVLNDVVEMSRPSVPPPLSISVQVEDGLPDTVVGDRGRISQILLNLVGNAVKFTERGSVQLRASTEKSSESSVQLRFSVTDTGPGIAAQDFDRLFQPFTRLAGGSGTEAKSGTGLGLSICKRLVEAMSGKIGVESSTGLGSTFWISIPLAKAEPTPPLATLETPISNSPLKPLRGRILVVDDKEANRIVAVRLLELLGLESYTATNGRDALLYLQNESYDAVLMDCRMPDPDGYEAAREWRRWEQEHQSGRRLPILAMTAQAMNEDRERALAAGMDLHLTKPLELEQLREALEHYLPSTSTNAGTAQHFCSQPLQPTPAPRTAVTSIDLSVLETMRELQRESQAKMNDGESLDPAVAAIREFESRITTGIDRLRRHLHKQDPTSTATEAAFIGASAKAVGANTVFAICREIEKRRLANGDSSIENLIDRLEVEGRQASAALQNWFASS